MRSARQTCGAIVALLLACSCSCGDDGNPGSSAAHGGEGGSGAQGSTTGTVGVGASAASGGNGSGGAGAVGAAAGWVPVTWENPCPNLQVATNPAAAAPSIAWEPCENGVSGCERLAGYGPDDRIRASNMAERGDGTWISHSISHKYDFKRVKVLFDPSGAPVLALRIPESDCVLGELMPTTDHLFFGAQSSTPAPSVFVRIDEAFAVEEILPFSNTVQGWAASDDLFVLETLGGSSSIVYDAASNTSTKPGLFDATTADNRVYGRESDRSTGPDIGGIRWSREHGEQLIVKQAGLSVRCLGTTGSDLFWASKNTADPNGVPAQLWRSPEVGANPADLQPTFVADLVELFGACEVMGQNLVYSSGYATDVTIHVRDLATDEVQSFPMEGDQFFGFNALTDTHIYYSSRTRPVRQALAR